MSSHCPWDPMRVELAATSPERADALLEMLLQQGEKVIATMQIADAHGWRRAAHGLAGSALNLGMAGLHRYCRQDVESTATQEQRTQLREAIRAELTRIANYKHSLGM